MKQYRITAWDIPQQHPEDCILPENDPAHEIMISQALGGLGAQARLDEYRAKQMVNKVECDKGKYQRENNVRPGTPAWFELWCGDKK